MTDFARTIVFGDVHGLRACIGCVADDPHRPTSDDLLVFLGDLVDKGRDSAAVLERLIHQLSEQCTVKLIQGNHEELMFAARESEGHYDTGRTVEEWPHSIRTSLVLNCQTFRKPTGLSCVLSSLL